jgi:ABC-2 type transport system ATP-binding protein
MSELAIETHDLVRVYRSKRSRSNPQAVPVVALDGVTVDVPRGELFGLLGPNGAGKTTLIKVLVTLLLPTSGTARVAGFDVVRDAHRVRERISMVSGGETSGYGLLTVREQLWMFSQFYGIPTRVALGRIDALLKVVGLYDERDRRTSQLSTGMRQKMNVVRGLLPDPEVLFLDEPTVGLDVEAARDIRAYVKTWMREKPDRTVLLTTHYMHEAEELCDRVAIIHQGRIVACDTPAGLRQRAAGGSHFVLVIDSHGRGQAPPLRDGEAAGKAHVPVLQGLPGVLRVEARILDGRTELRLHVEEDATIADAVRVLANASRKIYSVQKIEPSLEEAFVRIVGRRIEEADEPHRTP